MDSRLIRAAYVARGYPVLTVDRGFVPQGPDQLKVMEGDLFLRMWEQPKEDWFWASFFLAQGGFCWIGSGTVVHMRSEQTLYLLNRLLTWPKENYLGAGSSGAN